MTDDPLVRIALSGIERSISELHSNVRRLLDSAQQAATEQERLVDDIRELRGQLCEYISEDRRLQDRQLAQAVLLDIRARHDREFGHYEAVRRNVIGMLRAMDDGTALHATFQQAAERLLIDAPTYWLASAFAALAAWMRDSPTDAERAVRGAVSHDASRSALFFGLAEARHGRWPAAARWICEYLRELDGRSLGPEFVLVLDAVEQGAFGDAGRAHARAKCADWCAELMRDREVSKEQVANWRAFITSQGRSMQGAFDLLPRVSRGPEWIRQLSGLEAATAFGQFEQRLRVWFAATPASPQDRGPAIEGLIRTLVKEHDHSEASLLRAAEGWQKIAQPAEANVADLHRLDAAPDTTAETDFLALITNMALRRPSAAPSERTSVLALEFSRDLVKRAIGELREESLSDLPGFIDVDIDGWRRAVKPDDDGAVLAQEFADYVEAKMRADIDNVKVVWPWAKEKRMQRMDAQQVQWEGRKRAGQEQIHRIVTDVRKFFGRWRTEIAIARSCIELIDSESAAAQHSASAGTESAAAYDPSDFAMSPPNWDLRPIRRDVFFAVDGEGVTIMHGPFPA